MKYLFSIACLLIFLSGCATWKGVKEDASDAKDWTVEKVNKGASYVKEKTE